jgi:hypothetical protein
MEAVEAAALWPTAVLAIHSIPKPAAAILDGFHTLWTERGHRIREQLTDDSIVFDALRVLLPSYDGPGLLLYRGESWERHEKQAYGTAWSGRRDIAAMFASGLNAPKEGGGVLLSTVATASAIIAGPGRHSKFLGEEEYVVDRRQLGEVIVLERFPQFKASSDRQAPDPRDPVRPS